MYLTLIVRYKAVGSLYNGLRAAVVALEFECFLLWLELVEIKYVVYIGTSKRVDALCVVAYNA